MLWQFTILKMCVHEEYHLVLIFKDYLVSKWYVILMRNSISIMSINHLVGFFCLLLLKFNFLGLEIPLVLPRRLWWFYPGDSGPPQNFWALWKLTLTTYLKICFITLWGSIMLCAYYKSMKCVYLRLCHIVLIL
jgi:hypothetical protein